MGEFDNPGRRERATAEVGGEGGSFADARRSRLDVPLTGRGRVTGDEMHIGEIGEGGVGASPSPVEGAVRYPTEPPPSSDRPRAMQMSPAVVAGLVGGAAGALIAVGLMRLAARSRDTSDR